jgi:hypothetical protein
MIVMIITMPTVVARRSRPHSEILGTASAAVTRPSCNLHPDGGPAPLGHRVEEAALGGQLRPAERGENRRFGQCREVTPAGRRAALDGGQHMHLQHQPVEPGHPADESSRVSSPMNAGAVVFRPYRIWNLSATGMTHRVRDAGQPADQRPAPDLALGLCTHRLHGVHRDDVQPGDVDVHHERDPAPPPV